MAKKKKKVSVRVKKEELKKIHQLNPPGMAQKCFLGNLLSSWENKNAARDPSTLSDPGEVTNGDDARMVEVDLPLNIYDSLLALINGCKVEQEGPRSMTAVVRLALHEAPMNDELS